MRTKLKEFESCGIAINELRSVGGGARSAFGLQLKADILGIPVYSLKTRESACFGSAMLAGVACGIWDNIQEAAKLTEIQDVYLPRQENRSLYEQKFADYLLAFESNLSFIQNHRK